MNMNRPFLRNFLTENFNQETLEDLLVNEEARNDILEGNRFNSTLDGTNVQETPKCLRH